MFRLFIMLGFLFVAFPSLATDSPPVAEKYYRIGRATIPLPEGQWQVIAYSERITST